MAASALPDANRISATCACFNLRKSARLVTRMYDHKLRPSGIRATQFTILVAVQANAPVAIQALAQVVVMDRTTLARNLKPLVRNGLIAIYRGADRRVRQAELTTAGQKTLTRALPLWTAAQNELTRHLGASNLKTLLGALAKTVEAFQAD
jgi:DNA-binding MarR family transcriptional regulator